MATAIEAIRENQKTAWEGFVPGEWTKSVNTRDFIQKNYTPYEGDEKFLRGVSAKTKKLWEKLSVLLKKETEKGVLDADEEVVSSITSHAPGYIDRELEVIVGLQTDAPLKRALMPYGGLRMAKQALESCARRTSSRGFPTPTAAGASSGTTAASRFTGSIFSPPNASGNTTNTTRTRSSKT